MSGDDEWLWPKHISATKLGLDDIHAIATGAVLTETLVDGQQSCRLTYGGHTRDFSAGVSRWHDFTHWT